MRPSFSATMALAVMTRALPDLPRPFDDMAIRILRIPGDSSTPWKGSSLQTFQKVGTVVSHTAIALGQSLDGDVKIGMPKDCVTHRAILLQV